MGLKGEKKEKGSSLVKGGKSKAPAEKKEDLILACSIAATGRTPCDGYVMSIGFCAMTVSKKIMGTFSANMLPLSTTVVGSPDTLGFWRGMREELEAVTSDPQPPSVVMNNLVDWCKSFGKVNLTLAANPMLSVFSFLAHYLSVCCPSLKAPPWGYSGTCIKSYCCGLLGVDGKALLKSPTYLSWTEGLKANMVPGTDSVISAITLVNAMRSSLKLAVIPGPTGLPATTTVDQSMGRGCGGGLEDDAAADPMVVGTVAQWFDPAGAFCSSTGLVKPPPFWGLLCPNIVGDWLDDSVALPFVRYPSITDPSVLKSSSTSRDKSAQLEALLRQCSELLKGAEPAPRSRAQREQSATQSAAALGEMDWVATEKIHGANLSIITDGKIIRVGKRTSLLTKKEGGQFFGFDLVVSRIKDQIFALYDLVMVDQEANQSGHATVTVFGEIAGGEFSHPAIPIDLKGHRVQAGVQYAPFNFFYAFDVLVTTTEKTAKKGSTKEEVVEEGGASSSRFLPFDEACAAIDKAGLLRAEVRCRGPLAEVLQTPYEFTTTMPKIFRLPPLSGSNEAEGIVVRPVHDLWVAKGHFGTGGVGDCASSPNSPTSGREPSGGSINPWPQHSRVMFKLKHPKFCEMVTTNAPLATSSLYDVAVAMVTQGRLDSVLSKMTMSERGNAEDVFAAMAGDVLEATVTFLGEKKSPTVADFLSGNATIAGGEAPDQEEKIEEDAHRIKNAISHLIA